MSESVQIVPNAKSSALRILVADDHPIVRMGLRALIESEPDLEVVGEACDGAQAIELAIALQPDVVLMDLQMPNVDGVAATAAIASRVPGAKVLVVTTYERDADILRAVEAGATGYILKDTPRSVLLDALRAAARGETVLAPSVQAKLVSRLRGSAVESLTAREIQGLGAVATGSTNAEIGRALFISEATVKTHLLRTFAKLGVDDRTAAVTVATHRGFLRG